MSSQRPMRFRYNAAITIAAAVAALGAVPLATARWYLAPVLLLPLTVGVWSWRAGTDATVNGLRVRALFGSRSVSWSKVEAIAIGAGNRVYAHLTGGSALRLTAVTKGDLPRLVTASGEQLERRS